MADLTPPGDTSALTAALAAVGRAPGDATKAAVYERLLGATLLAPLDPLESTAEQAVMLVERTPAGLELPLFSAAEPFRLWGVVPTHLTAAAPELFQAALRQGIDRVVLDPAGPVRVALGSWEVRRIAFNQAPAVHGSPDRDQRTPLGPPDPPLPEAFADALHHALEDQPVTEATVFEADPVRGRRHLVIALRADDPAPVVDAIHDRLAPEAPDQALLNYTALTGELPAQGTTVYRA